MFIGRNASGLFPSSSPTAPHATQPPSLPDDQRTITAHSPARIEEGYADSYPPPPMDSENDIWENRWKDRDFHLMERMRRMETDLHSAVERAVIERDQTWAKWLTMKYKQLIDRLEQTGQLSQHDLETLHTNPPNP